MAKRNCARIEIVSKFFLKDCSPFLEALLLYFMNAVGKKGNSLVVTDQTSGNTDKKSQINSIRPKLSLSLMDIADFLLIDLFASLLSLTLTHTYLPLP